MIALIIWSETLLIMLLILIILNLNGWQNLKFLKLYFIWGVSNLISLFPKDKKLILFGSERGKKIDGNPWQLYLEAKKSSFRCVWILKSSAEVEKILSQGGEAYLASSVKGRFLQVRATLLIHSHAIGEDFCRYLVRGAISINTWHGVGLKKVWGANKKTMSYRIIHGKSALKRFLKMPLVRINLTKKAYMVATSDTVAAYYPETFLVPQERVLKLGQARNDVFFEEEMPSFFNEFSQKKKILYMPTHRQNGKNPYNILSTMEIKKVEKICQQYGAVFFIKLHPFHPVISLKESEFVRDISSIDIPTQYLLKGADILITDYSSCYTDFLLLDRPILFYAYDLATYLSKDRMMYFDFESVTPGPIYTNAEEFYKGLSLLLGGQDLFQEERHRVRDIFYSIENQGRVAEKQWRYFEKNFL